MADKRLVKANGLEDAIIGVGSRMNMPDVLIYSYNECVKIFMEKEGWTHEEAIEWMDFNVVGAWVGDTTPIFVHEIPSDQKIDEFLEELGFDQPANDN